MSKKEVISLEAGKAGEINEADGQTHDIGNTANERWFPDLKKMWRESDPQTALLLSASRGTRPSSRTLTAEGVATLPALPRQHLHQQQTGDEKAQAVAIHPQPDNAAKVLQGWFNPVTLAALPFHHLIPAEKLASAFAAMPASLIRPHTVGEVERRRQFFWQSLAAAGVSAKVAVLLDDSLHCRFTDSAAGKTIETDWEVHYYDELQGCAEMYRAEMLAFKRRIYEAGDDLRNILELRADEFLCYLNDLTFNINCIVDSPINSEACAVIETDNLERWFLHNLTGSFALTISEMRNGNEDHSIKNKPRKTKSAASDYTSYRTYEAKRIESSMSSSGDDEEDDQTTRYPNETSAAAALIVSTTVYRLRLADYWLDWQRATRTARFDFDFLEALTDVRAMRFYELTKLWRLQSSAATSAIIPGGGAGDLLPDTLEIEYDRFASLMPLPRLRYEREVKEQLKQIIKPLKASGYVKSFAVKTDWRGLSNVNRLVFKFNDDFSASQK